MSLIPKTDAGAHAGAGSQKATFRRKGSGDGLGAMIRDLARNLYAGARLSFMLPVDRAAFRPSLDQAFGLLVVGSLAMLCIEAAASDGTWLPPPDRVGFYALALLAGLVGCFAATRLLGLTERLSTIVVMLLAGAFWVLPVFGPVFILADPASIAPNAAAGVIVGVLLVTWLFGIAIRSIHMITGRGLIRPAVAASVLVIVTALPKLVLTTPATWLPAPAKLPDTWTQENLYYGQFGMMDRAIGWLGKNRAGKTDLYFVGFAADTRDAVYLHEMRAVTQLFANRFGAGDRSVVMVNSGTTVRQAPLANLHNLGRTISEIGERMDGKEDVLFLYLSAPSLSDGAIKPVFAPLDFVPIDPTSIRRMLDEAGIKYRIIVFSGCNTAGFTDHLRGPTTLVINASGKNRRATGCTGDGAYTDFGEAFFGDALNRGFDLPDAFDKARALLAEKHASSLRPAPTPEVRIGARMAPKLDELAAQLESDFARTTTVPTITAPEIRPPKIRKQ